MVDDVSRLGIEVDSRDVKKASGDLDRFSKEGKKASGAAGKVEKSSKSMAGGMKRAATAVGAAVAALAAFGGSIRILSGFERQMSTVGAVSRSTAGELAAMRDIAADLGSTTEFTAQQAASGLEFLARAGFSASESISAIPAVLDLATASALGLGQAADISSNIMSAFGIAATDAASVADVLAGASSRANTDVTQLGSAMSFVGPVASSLGIEMSDAAAAIGVLSDAGIQGSAAGTGLRRVLSSLANPTGEAESRLSALGLTMEQLNPQTNDITEIVERLAGAGLSAADALTIFGDRGGPAILALTSQVGGLRDLTDELTNVGGEAQRMADVMRDNLGGDIDSLISSLQGLVIALGDAGLTAILRGVIKVVTFVTRAISGLVDVIGSVTNGIADFISSATSVATAEETLGRIVDNTTLAMGDQIEQTQLLATVQRDGNLITLETASARLGAAQAAREELQALKELNKQQFLEQSGFNDALQRANEIRDRLAELRDSPGAVLGQRNAASFVGATSEIDNLERNLAGVLNRIEDIKIAARGQLFLTDENEAALAELEKLAADLEKGINLSKDGMVKLNGEVVEGIDLSERFALTANGISFDRATGTARLLAAQMGIAVDKAIALDRALNRTAGIDEPRSTGRSLGFGDVGSLPPSVGGFSAAGGELTFGDNPGRVRAEDFRPQNIREIEEALVGLGSAGAAAGDAISNGLDKASRKGGEFADTMQRSFVGLVTGAQSLSGALDQVLGRLADLAANSAFDSLFGGGGKSGGGGGIFGSILGGIGSIFGGGSSLAPESSPVPVARPSFAGGGFTGNGPRAGGIDGQGGFPAILHPREVVTDLTNQQRAPVNVTSGRDTARLLGNRPQIVPVEVNVINNSQGQVQQNRRRGPGGQEIIDIAVSDSISSGRQDKVLSSRFGNQPQAVRR